MINFLSFNIIYITKFSFLNMVYLTLSCKVTKKLNGQVWPIIINYFTYTKQMLSFVTKMDFSEPGLDFR